MSAPSTPLLVNTKQAAEMLSVSSRTIWELSINGQLKVTRIGRAVRFSVAELQRFIAAREAANA